MECLMRLVNYGAGEITDRLTILALKILIGSEQGKDTKHFQTERTALLTKLGAQTLNGAWFTHVLELGAVNAALWHAEDDLRGWRQRWTEEKPDETGISGPGKGYVAATALEVARVGIRIQALNDQRAALVQAINEKTGEHLGEEKL
jgi:hypothetical protein